MDKRRGALAPDQIALLILAIAGFALAALFLFGVFQNKDLSERELCRLSVLSRATVPGVVEDAVPLNCHTEKICITAKKGFVKKVAEVFTGDAIKGTTKSVCKQFAGEENIRDIEVVVDNNPINQKESAKLIQGEVANAMYDCWTMTGQGKLDIWTTGEGEDFGEKIVDEGLEELNLKQISVAPRCIVCSRVAFSDYFYQEDKKVQDAVLKQVDYNLYLSREKVPGSSLTYIQTFTDESVGSGYGAVSLQESLQERLTPYIGRKDLTAEEFSRVKEILTEVKNSIAIPDDKKPLEELLKSDEKINKFLQGFDKQSSAPLSQIAIVFTQIKVSNIKPNDAFWKAMESGAVVGGLAAISGPGKIASLLIPGPGWVKALFKIGSIGAISLNLAVNAEKTTIKNQALSAATCGTFESKISGDQRGCSLVKLMAWSVEGINNLCTGGIEGNL